MADTRPRVLLDTTALVETGFGQGPAFRHLLRDAQDKRVEVIIPEVVVAEAVFVYRRRLFDVRDALKQLPGLLRAAGYERDALERPVLQRRMEHELRERLTAAGIVTAPAPEMDADELVRRILARRKPTKPLVADQAGLERPDQGEGFRDQLIWEHVRVAAEQGPIVFVSGNRDDFADKKTVKDGRAELHPQLEEDLEADRAAGRSTGDVELVLDLVTFVDQFLKDEDADDDLQRLLEDGAEQELTDEVRRLVGGQGADLETFVPPVAVQGDLEEARLTAVSGPFEVELQDVYVESAEDEPRIYGATLTVRADGDVDWLVSAPSTWDLEVFGAYVEGDRAGGGFITDHDTTRVQLSVYGHFSPSKGGWDELEIMLAEQERAESAERQKRNRQRQHELEDDLGLWPEPPDEDDEDE